MIKEDLERINKRGPADLEEQIDQLKKQVTFSKVNVDKQAQLFLTKS